MQQLHFNHLLITIYHLDNEKQLLYINLVLQRL